MIQDNQLKSKVETGIHGFDNILAGGLPSKRIAHLKGPSGAGKTTIGLQFLLEGTRLNESCLYIGTSENEDEIKENVSSHEWDLSGITLAHLLPENSEEEDKDQDIFHPSDIDLPKTVEKLLQLIQTHKPQRLVIDSLSDLRLFAQEPAWYRKQLLRLKTRLYEAGCTTLLTDLTHSSEGIINSIVSSEIDLHFDSPSFGAMRRRIHINKLRGSDFRSGYHDYAIRKGGVFVFPRISAIKNNGREPGRECLSTGVRGLDEMLGDEGLDKGSSHLILGSSGTGKSSLLMMMAAEAAKRGERSLIFIFDESIRSYIARAKVLELDIDKFMNEGLIKVEQVDPAEKGAGEFSFTVEKRIKEESIDIVGIDSLNGYAFAMPDVHYLTIHLHELIGSLSSRGVTTLMTMLDKAKASPFEVSYVADTVLRLTLFERNGELLRALGVHKRRGGTHSYSIHELENCGPLEVGEKLSLSESRGRAKMPDAEYG